MRGEELTPELLLAAYSQGIFPMAEGRDDPEVHWIEPKRRGLLPLDGFHVSRSLGRTIRQGRFAFGPSGSTEPSTRALAEGLAEVSGRGPNRPEERFTHFRPDSRWPPELLLF